MLRRLWSHLLLGTAAFVVAAASVVAGTTSQAGTIVEPWIDTSNRDAVAVAFAAEYASDAPGMDWSGNYETCDAGDSSRRLASATLRRVNFYRAMAGVPAGVTLSGDYSAKAQHAALAMSATGRLSHTPDDTFDCLSDTGREAAANSNLYLGRTGPRAIDGYIEDPGDRNIDVGHRNTILHPPTAEIGVGHVAGSDTAYPANALWVFDERVFDDSPSLREPEGWVAWPPRGHVPAELVYPRWSFGMIGADFDGATVTMSTGGEPIEIEVIASSSEQGYVPAPIIVWEPVVDPGSVEPEADRVVDRGAGDDDEAGSATMSFDPAHDTEYDVVVSGVVVDGAEIEYSYTVVVMGEGPPPGPDDDRGVVDLAVRNVTDAARTIATATVGRLG